MNKLLVAVGVSGLFAGGWKLTHRSHSDDDRLHVTDRFWIDHMPKHDREFVRAIAAFTHDHDQTNVGFVTVGSRWHAQFDGFRFDLHGDDLAVEFPQNSWKATWHTKVTRCSVGEFTLCLEVTAPRGTFLFFSRDEWVVGSEDAARALEAKLLDAAPSSIGAESSAPAAIDSLAP